MNTLQSLVFPNLDVRATEDMYLRLNDRCWADLGDGSVRFEEGGVLSSDTFYNALTVDAWKRHCEIDALVLSLSGRGDFVLTIGVHRRGQGSVWLGQHRVGLQLGATLQLPVSAWPTLADGLLFFRLRALGSASLESASFQTPDGLRNDVRLGLVITHFNRQAQVMPAIARIRKSLLDHAALGSHVTLTVVDNSANLPLAPHPRITHILNRNLGGAGGFARGLLSLIDSGTHSHALFMDDDASCETESVARTLSLLQHARRSDLAVAGALLRELAPWELREKGARFEGQVLPLKSGLDVRRVSDLLEAEREVERPDYGAWWFFAFPIAQVRQFPFPFFVRGDDIQFGLGNRFDIVTLNGVACFGEDFSSKHGPMTAYLDARYHLVHALLAPRGTARSIYWVGSKLFLKSLTSYLYTSARAVTLAVEHVMQGPRFFVDNIDMQRVRTQIASWAPSEKMLPLERRGLAVKGPRIQREKPLRRLLRIVTLQGFLLPGVFLRDRMTLQSKHFHGRASAVFRYRRVLYEHEQNGTGFVAEFDRPRFFGELGRFIKAWASLFMRMRALQRDYAEGVDDLTTQSFWRDVYGEPAGSHPAPVETVEPSEPAEALEPV